MNKILPIILVVVLSGCATNASKHYYLKDLITDTISSTSKEEKELPPTVYICPLVLSHVYNKNSAQEEVLFKSKMGGKFDENYIMFAASTDNAYLRSSYNKFLPLIDDEMDSKKRFKDSFSNKVDFMFGNIHITRSRMIDNRFESLFMGLSISDLKLTRIIEIFDPTKQLKHKWTKTYQCFTKKTTNDLSGRALECGSVPYHSQFKKYTPDFKKRNVIIDFNSPELNYFYIKDRAYIYNSKYEFLVKRLKTEQPIVENMNISHHDSLACRDIIAQ